MYVYKGSLPLANHTDSQGANNNGTGYDPIGEGILLESIDRIITAAQTLPCDR